jgi:hypothetical protein
MILTDRIFEEEQAVEYLKFTMNPSLEKSPPFFTGNL